VASLTLLPLLSMLSLSFGDFSDSNSVMNASKQSMKVVGCFVVVVVAIAMNESLRSARVRLAFGRFVVMVGES
jgi:hypothetical protein